MLFKKKARKNVNDNNLRYQQGYNIHTRLLFQKLLANHIII